MSRRNPFKWHRFPKDVILLAVRWYCRYPLPSRDVRDLLAKRGITIDATTVIGECGSSAPRYEGVPIPPTPAGRSFSVQ